MRYSILVFGHEKCEPCKVLKRELEKEKIHYTYVDVEKYPKIANEYLISSVPTTIILQNQKVIEFLIGNGKEILNTIKKYAFRNEK